MEELNKIILKEFIDWMIVGSKWISYHSYRIEKRVKFEKIRLQDQWIITASIVKDRRCGNVVVPSYTTIWIAKCTLKERRWRRNKLILFKQSHLQNNEHVFKIIIINFKIITRLLMCWKKSGWIWIWIVRKDMNCFKKIKRLRLILKKSLSCQKIRRFTTEAIRTIGLHIHQAITST